ncbi:MAG: UbiX family flavin prenyltransferase [Ignavibacteriales bacterium]|nr:UbiX family flavin prenyltransferase [Ignavibacteriales bacterium]
MKILISITGSSGAVYAVDFLKKSTSDKYLILSKWGKALLRDEMKMTEKDLQPFIKRQFSNDDLSAPPASGTNRFDANIILPCSSSTLGKIASGIGDTLITRAAQVALKERLPLFLCLRETPLSTLALEQAARLSAMGAFIMPVSPALYYVPQTVEEYVGSFTGKLLDVIGECRQKGWRSEELE